jgi:hypothetical protein
MGARNRPPVGEKVTDIASAFPHLSSDGYKITSKETHVYNCIAWAAGIDTAWWDTAQGYTWPQGAPRDNTIKALITAYECIGFEICEGEMIEAGYDKIAVYGDADGWTHAARQLPSGKWTSKLGRSEDIEHATPQGLVGSAYGSVVSIMRRRKG